jgi:hypothetical protein
LRGVAAIAVAWVVLFAVITPATRPRPGGVSVLGQLDLFLIVGVSFSVAVACMIDGEPTKAGATDAHTLK